MFDLQAAFSALSASSGILILIVGDDGIIKFVSEQITSCLGFTETEIIGTIFDNGPSIMDLIDEKVGNKQYKRLHKNGAEVVMECIILNTISNGDYILLERMIPTTQIVPTPNASELPQIVVEDFVENGAMALKIVTPDGKIAWANKAELDILGFSVDEYIGSSVTNYHEDADNLCYILTRLKNNEIITDHPCRLRHKNGSIRHVRLNSSVRTDLNGEFANTRCFLRDVTDQILVEQEKQAAIIEAKSAQTALEMKSLFLARMSHDIRTPLNGVIGMAALLQSTELSNEQKEFTNVIESSSSFLLTLIQDILDHSKIEAGKIDLDPRPTNLVQLVGDCADIVRIECCKKDIELKVTTHHNDSFTSKQSSSLVHIVDDMRLKQIITNFLSNSIKFTSKGFVSITLDVKPSSSSSSSSSFDESDESNQSDDDIKKEKGAFDDDDVMFDDVYICVEDTGIGIKNSSELFGNFKQATKSTTREYGGTGLGLSIAKSLTELMNGKIALESEFGKGSRIWCDFKFRRLFQPQQQSLSMNNQRHVNQKQKDYNIQDIKQLNKKIEDQDILHWKENVNILIAEDNKINQKVLVNMLKRLGYQHMKIADNGQIALDYYIEKRNTGTGGAVQYDLILMDCLMPVLGGIEATEKIRALENQSTGTNKVHVPIIALTANAQESDKLDCFRSGMDGFITKPINIDILGEELLKWRIH